LVRAAREQLWFGVVQLAIATVFGIIALAGHRPIATAAGLVFEAAFYGGFMWWFGLRRLRRDVEGATEIDDPTIRDNRTTVGLLVLYTVGLVAVFAALTLLSSDPRSILAGIALGGGVDGLAYHRWLRRWESDHSIEVLRVPSRRRRKGINNYRVT
jgi:small-conductance mechanosensitive channel